MTHFTVGIIVPENELPDIDSFIDQPDEALLRVIRRLSLMSATRSTRPRPRSNATSAASSGSSNGRTPLTTSISAARPSPLRVTTPEERYREYVAGAEEFNAQGEPLSTYNPDSKWDWYASVAAGTAGSPATKSSDQGLNFGPGHETLANNIATTEQAIERDIVPHAIVTPDGQWHERGQMGWWAIMITENEDWDAQARELLSSYPGHHVVLLDAHI